MSGTCCVSSAPVSSDGYVYSRPFLRFPSYLVIGGALGLLCVKQPLHGSYNPLGMNASGRCYLFLFITYLFFTNPNLVTAYSLLSTHYLLGSPR